MIDRCEGFGCGHLELFKASDQSLKEQSGSKEVHWSECDLKKIKRVAFMSNPLCFPVFCGGIMQKHDDLGRKRKS